MMGIAAYLFFGSNDPKNTLDWRIRPSDEQFEVQQARWNHLAEYLIDDLSAISGATVKSWLQGSYKFGTQIRPASKFHEFDIDLGVYFLWDGQANDGNHSPLDLKGMIQTSLQSYQLDPDNDATSVSPPKARCSRVHFSEDFHIDVPGYHLDESRDARSLATDRDEWEQSDPKAIYKWWVDNFEVQARARARRLVRYLKMWAALRFSDGDRPSSIMLTVLVGEEFKKLDLDGISGDDELFAAVVTAITERLGTSGTIPNPVDTSENLNRLTTADFQLLRAKMESLAEISERALAQITIAESAEVWSEAFEHFFPAPADLTVLEEVTKTAGTAVATAFVPEVAVRAQTQGAIKQTFNGLNQIGPVPRNCDITFSLSNWLELPAGSVVSWTVRNEGDEAEDLNDLGHQAGTGIAVERQSAYVGVHHMDVSVRRYGRLIGRRRIAVTIQDAPRTKAKRGRPANVSLKGRR